jgi:hypothetical protein
MSKRFGIVCYRICLLTGIALIGCSSAEKIDQDRSRAWVDKIALKTLHYRRPQGASADPQAGPGGSDYQSQPLPNSNLDCEPAENLFQGLQLSAIRACLSSANLSAQDFILTYSVQKSIQPLLILRKEDVKKDEPHRPACVDELLGSIPVPREIFFQGVRDIKKGELGCFAAGLTPDTSPLLGFRLNTEKTEIDIKIPPARPLKTTQDVRLLLMSWALRPFWSSQRNQIESRVVPDRMCRLCIGEKNLVHVQVPRVPLWPSDGDAGFDFMQSVDGSGTDVPVGTPNLPEQTGIN